MKRFIRYLYEYQEGKRIRNVGFVKVEQDDACTVVHIHGKGLHLEGKRRLKVYVFYVEEEQCVGVWQGDVENVNPSVNYRLSFTEEDTGTPEKYPLVEGVILENEGGHKFAAVWNDMPADVDHMKVWKEEEPARGIYEEAAERVRREEEESRPEDGGEPSAAPDSESQSGMYCIKIQRQDIAQLKRCEWRLANNSFLLHGYYNYHHLILIQEEDQVWLGVPGVYHSREAQAAEAFGFPRFVRVSDEAVDLKEEEKNEVDDFGYWCRKVRKA